LPPGGLRGPEGGETPGGEGVKVVFSCGCVFTREKDPYTGRVEYTRDGCPAGEKDHMEVGYAVLRIMETCNVAFVKTEEGSR